MLEVRFLKRRIIPLKEKAISVDELKKLHIVNKFEQEFTELMIWIYSATWKYTDWHKSIKEWSQKAMKQERKFIVINQP